MAINVGEIVPLMTSNIILMLKKAVLVNIMLYYKLTVATREPSHLAANRLELIDNIPTLVIRMY